MIEELLSSDKLEISSKKSDEIELYEGMQVLQKISYKGPTSIKYWM